MKKTNYTFGSLLFVALLASAAHAQVQRTFVSGLGSDSNACSRTAPCRTFAQAISQTNPGGEVYVLDSAGYGAFTINKSVSVVAPLGVTAGISVFSGDGIDINAGLSDTVILRGLTINNQGSTGNGIAINTGQNVQIEGCVISGFSDSGSNHGNGVLYQNTNTFDKLDVKDSIIRGNFNGIVINAGAGSVLAEIDQVRLEWNAGLGLFVEDGAKVTVRNSIATGNGDGFFAQANSSGPAEMNIENCVASNNVFVGIGARALFSFVATVRVSNSTVTDNGIGLQNLGPPAVLLSRGNNTAEGNGSNTSGTIGSYTAK